MKTEVVWVPWDFPKIDFEEHKFVRSKLGHVGRGNNNRVKITKDNVVYVRTFGRSADFGMVSYLEAYKPDEKCRDQALAYRSLGILEVWREKYCKMKEVWGVCVWPEMSSTKQLCLEQDPTNKNRLLWVKRYWEK